MKKIFRNTMWIALGAIAWTGCSNDSTEEPTPAATQGRTITVVASLSDETKASFVDGESIQWAAGDILRSIAYRAPENGEWTWAHESDPVESAATTAEFSFKDIQPDETNVPVWFVQQATAYGNANQIEFVNHNRDADGERIQLQAKAGEMDSRYLLLLSDRTSWEDISGGASVRMRILGHILRFIPYSSDATYRQESVQSVKFTTKDTGIGGIIRKNLVKDSGDLYGGFNDLTVRLATPFALTEADSKANSHGIYMTVAPVENIAGYSIVVTTDAATYTFNGMDKTLVLNEGGVMNIGLDLKNGIRVANEDYEFDVRYAGDFNAVENTLWSSDAHAEIVNGYWCAQAAPKGTQEWANMDNINDENKKFYQVSFEITDNATNAPADWVTCTQAEYRTVWRIALSENTSNKERSATIKATYPNTFEGGYVILPEYKTKSIVIRQDAKVEVQASLSNVYNETISKAGETIAAAKLTLTINGADADDVNAAMQQYGITANCGAATSSVDAEGNVTVSFPENRTAKEKSFTLNINYKNAAIATAAFTQEAGEGDEEQFPYTYELSTAGPGWGSGWGFPANTVHEGNYAFIQNVKLNGELVTLTDEIAETVVAYAFRSTAPTDEEKSAVGQAAKTASDTGAVARVRWFDGTRIDVAFRTGASQSITKVTGYSPDGAELGSWMIWID